MWYFCNSDTKYVVIGYQNMFVNCIELRVEKTYYYIEENGFQKKRIIIIRDISADPTW